MYKHVSKQISTWKRYGTGNGTTSHCSGQHDVNLTIFKLKTSHLWSSKTDTMQDLSKRCVTNEGDNKNKCNNNNDNNNTNNNEDEDGHVIIITNVMDNGDVGSHSNHDTNK